MGEPLNIKKYNEYIEYSTIKLIPDENLSAMIKHAFIQIGNSVAIINKWTKEDDKVTATKVKFH